jgi:3-hydroxy-9,10-secoandrosta-1,3,5(10)-triene-9,17-dione monooxygenase reductase component
VSGNVDQAAFRLVLARFATGVTVVTADEDGEPVGFTCQSFVSLSLEPPLVALAPAKTSTSWPRIARAGSFCVNVLAEHQRDLCERFARPGGDKFVGVAWRPAPVGGAPVLEGSIAWVACELELVHDAGDHELVIGRVRDLGTGHGAPLVFYDRHFGTFVERGQFRAPAGALDTDGG